MTAAALAVALPVFCFEYETLKALEELKADTDVGLNGAGSREVKLGTRTASKQSRSVAGRTMTGTATTNAC
ncbi:hypothetical protein EVAR_87618_1 [Eumeta japonica]|uniref:Uncharacterized protein n=1 Tax=Eumeta variegata TaxID=151549 RepID=A0A4C1WKN0_EUMVA|nr:hypothetical protein EVAR_87618_1 [Eumeta japonica]